MKNVRAANTLLNNLQENILVTGITGAGKSTLLSRAKIKNSKYYDFDMLRNSRSYHDTHFLREENAYIYLDDILNSEESTIILDSVEFPLELEGSVLSNFVRKARKHGKRLIVVTYPSEAERVKHLFGAVISLSVGWDGKNKTRECKVDVVS